MWQYWNQQSLANDLAKKGFDQQEIADRLKQVTLVEQGHEQREDALKAAQARRDADAQAMPEKDRALAKRNAQIATAFEEAAEKRRFTNERESAYGNHPAENAGQGEAELFVTTAAIKADRLEGYRKLLNDMKISQDDFDKRSIPRQRPLQAHMRLPWSLLIPEADQLLSDRSRSRWRHRQSEVEETPPS